MGKSIYLTAFVATLAIVLIILFSIRVFEENHYSQINQELNDIYFQGELDKVYSGLIDQNSNLYCPYLLDSIDNTSYRLYTIGVNLSNYQDRLSGNDYIATKKNYLVTNILLLNKIAGAVKECNYSIKPVIYFYDADTTCSVECGVVVNLLDQIQSDCNKARIFAFPLGIPEYKFADLVAMQYDVNAPFTLVINNKKFAYPQKKEDLLNELGCLAADRKA